MLLWQQDEDILMAHTHLCHDLKLHVYNDYMSCYTAPGFCPWLIVLVKKIASLQKKPRLRWRMEWLDILVVLVLLSFPVSSLT